MIKQHKNLLLITGIILLAITALMMNPAGEFSGADGTAESAIAEIDPGYKPWAENIWTPPSGEIESLMFAMQAAIGSGVLFYIFGYWRGRRRAETDR